MGPLVTAAAFAFAASLAAPGAASVPLARLRVTSGELRETAPGHLVVDRPSVRAVVAGGPGDSARLAFAYLGPTREDAPLASGEVRRQVALKLRARDSCNVVYVAWRIEPRPGVVVSVKANPGAGSHAECGARGYREVAPRAARAAPAVAPGTRHALAAVLDGRELRVRADGAPVWEGTLPEAALAFDGPVGLRTDNVRVELELAAGRAAAEGD